MARTGPKRPRGVTRDAVRSLRAAGKSPHEIAEILGVSKGTVAYHMRRFGAPPDTRFARRYDWAEIRRAYEDEGLSMRACMQRFGFTSHAWSIAVRRGDIKPRPREIPIEALLVRGCRRGRHNLKNRLIQAGLKENCCERCGISEWQGKPLSMQLHHINGDGLDNRLGNLEFLCGNCHSQTDTYGGRNGHRRKRRIVGEQPN